MQVYVHVSPERAGGLFPLPVFPSVCDCKYRLFPLLLGGVFGINLIIKKYAQYEKLCKILMVYSNEKLSNFYTQIIRISNSVEYSLWK